MLADLRCFCIRWGRYFGLSYEDAEDGAQEIAIRAWRTNAQFATHKAMHGFAKLAMRRWIIDQQRSSESKRVRCSLPLFHSCIKAPDTEPSDTAHWLASQCRDARDRVTLYAMAYEYTPAEQAQRWPMLFSCVEEAYEARRLLRGRLRRAYNKAQ